MRYLLVVAFVIFVIFFYCFEETSSQAITPIGYGSSPTVYSQSDDDLGLLLTILLLAGRNKNDGRCGQMHNCCNCCNCCNCGDNSQNIPIPFPIPFPTNNAIVNRAHKLYEDYDSDDDEDDSDDSNEELNKTVLKGDRGKNKTGTGNAATIVQEVEVEQEAEGESDDPKSKSN